MMPLLVSFSGGRTSALLARMIQTSPLYEGVEKHYVYANTGRERSETLDFIHECDRRWNLGVVWLEAVVNPAKGEGTRHRVVTYETAIRNTDATREGHPFEAVVGKYGLPSNAFPHCTRELKLNPIASYMKSIGVTQYDTAIGIRADEPHRAQPKPGIVYPLVDLRINEHMVRTFWDRQDFDLQLKDYQGNCDLCFKKSLRKRLTILRETPEIADWWAKLEGWRADHRGQMNNLVFDRNGLSVKVLLTLLEDPKFTPVMDRHEQRQLSPELFDVLEGIDLDFETDCICRSGGIPA